MAVATYHDNIPIARACQAAGAQTEGPPMMDPPRKGYTPNACVNNCHKWHALCGCGGCAVCLRCGVGVGTIPCQCQVPRWTEAELVTRTQRREWKSER